MATCSMRGNSADVTLRWKGVLFGIRAGYCCNWWHCQQCTPYCYCYF